MNAPAAIDRPLRLDRLRDFVGALADLVQQGGDDAHCLVEQGSALLAGLVAQDDWLPPAYAVPDPTRYQQYLLHCDSRERFSIVSFVWAPGQATPVHDHRVWGLVGVLRGAERIQRYRRTPDGGIAPEGAPEILRAGEVDAVTPGVGDIHQVANALDDTPSVSIHVYGTNIGAVRRATYAPDGTEKLFISGYAPAPLPNIWNRSDSQ